MTPSPDMEAANVTTVSRLVIEGLGVTYRRAGVGSPLVLLQGFTQDSRVWRPQLAALADAFTVVAWDAPGAGESDDPPEGYALADWADCLARFMDAAGLDRATVGGLSWGGLHAYHCVHRQRPRDRDPGLGGSNVPDA